MDEYDVTGWDEDLIDELYSAPSDELYAELSETQILRNTMAHSVMRSNMDILFTQEAIDEYLAHYGTPRHSGRYPWGSGKNPQRSQNWLQRADDLAAQGLSEKQIAEAFGMSTTVYRQARTYYREQRDHDNQNRAMHLFYDKQWSKTAIAEELGVSEGTVRNYLDPTKKRRELKSQNVANELKEMLKERPYLDVGEGVERQLNITDKTLDDALFALKQDGYSVLNYNLPQVSNPTQHTNLTVLAAPGTTTKDLSEHLGQITTPTGLYFEDGGELTFKNKPVESISSKRVAVNYAETGGTEKDGLIEIRPGTEDLSLGGRNYAQVRIAVDGTHYLKGMAVYGDPKEWKSKKIPADVDIVFNTNKHEGTPMISSDDDNTVLKKMKKDPTNPFGANFREWKYEGSDGQEHQSPINIVNDDSDWSGWQKVLSAQFASKQRLPFTRKQLDLKYSEMADELDEIKSITNPTLKAQLLDDFASQCDSAAVHLQAAALPRQGTFAILPIPSLKPNEVYAPMYQDGEEVILVRHPHEGTFQIPRLIVNNGNAEGKRVLGTMASNAIGINAKAANQLSGADYDGDTVIVLPTKGQNLRSRDPLPGLVGYDPSDYYKRRSDDPMCTGKDRFNDDGTLAKKGDGFNRGMEMGRASNLITDMTLKGADFNEIERAVRYSMCVIDAEKHNLDWKQAAIDNGIDQLRKDYQLHVNANGNPSVGASTLISKARSPVDVPDRKQIYSRDAMTDEEKKRYDAGEIIYRETGRKKAERKKITDTAKMTPEELEKFNNGESVYRNTGKYVPVMTKGKALAEVSDAHELSTGTQMENIYAEHSNRMKALANEARKLSRATGLLKKNPSAEKAYEDVVGTEGSLTKKLALAMLEAPKERQAQILANSMVRKAIDIDPELKADENKDKLKKIRNRAINLARDAVNNGVHQKRYRIELTDREWEAIQAGAISNEKMKQVIRYSDKTELRKRATPRKPASMKPSTKSRARMMLNAGYAPSTVASELGISIDLLRREFKNFSGINEDGD